MSADMIKAVALIAATPNEQLGVSDWLNVSNPHGLPGPVRFGIIHSNTPATLSPVSTGDAHNWRVFIA